MHTEVSNLKAIFVLGRLYELLQEKQKPRVLEGLSFLKNKATDSEII